MKLPICLSILLSLGTALGDLFKSEPNEVTTNPAYVCSFCVLAIGLMEESAFQLHLLPYLQSQCASEPCKDSVERMVLSIEGKNAPEETNIN